MAFQTGTAADAQDFYDKLETFLTTNADLMAASQNWTVVWQRPSGGAHPGDKVLKGPGLAGTDNIYVGMRLNIDDNNDEYSISLSGATGVLQSATWFDQHQHTSPKTVRAFLDNDPMQYWMIANGRRFAFVVRIGTVFEHAYAGLFLPYGTPQEYPYPMFVGGTARGLDAGNNGRTNSYRDTNEEHVLYMKSPVRTENQIVLSNGYVMLPDNSWIAIGPYSDNVTAFLSFIPEEDDHRNLLGNELFNNENHVGAYYLMDRMMEGYGGVHATVPLVIARTIGDTALNATSYGYLDGVHRCQGHNMAAMDTIQSGSASELVFPNIFRTGLEHFYALRME